ncbi:protein lifeguard 2-like [Physella acuta]|uniref:protein lifeguard 2-like n=1 Tax=Physella acuta TaxID=109671 RepID=UPI0027DDA1BF|nr:protein lifeguard 2-like [Physella acuta]XP_059154729.1 protein lifeguard 2-like [Physella acuta]
MYQQTVVVYYTKPLEDPEKRRAFITKTYTVLLIQFIFTALVVAACTLLEPVKIWLKEHFYLIYVCMFLYLCCAILMCFCAEKLMTTNPTSVGVIVVLTIAEAGTLGFVTSTKAQEIVLIAAVATVACFFVLTIAGICCKFDFTGFMSVMFVIFLMIMLFGILAAILHSYVPILRLIYACLGALAVCVYIIIDTQLIMGGKRHQLEPEMYILAAILLYIDLVMLFMYILEIAEYSKD